MIVELHENFQHPARLHASRVLITSEDGTPVALIVQYATEPHAWFRCFRAGDPDFDEQLRTHGIKATVLVTPLSPTSGKAMLSK